MNITYIKATAGGGGTTLSTAKLMKTGQTTSYRTGDDGDLQEGRDVDFFTLAENNPFGTTDRFTDELGTQVYANDIVIDWSTYDGSEVLGYRRTHNGVNINWADAIDGALAVSIGTFTTGWRLPNYMETLSLINWQLPGVSNLPFRYPPFDSGVNNIGVVAGVIFFWTATTDRVTTGNAYTIVPGNYSTAFAQSALKTAISNRRYFPCRTFTVTGTTLS